MEDNGPARPRPSIGAADRSLRDQVYEELRERIIEGDLEPGRRLVEREIAAELEVSRVPVREAVQRLQAEGFVTGHPRRGAVVARLLGPDLAHFFDIRESLEELAAGLAAERADPAGRDRLGALLAAARRAGEAGAAGEIAASNAAFHAEIVALSGNPMLVAIMEPLNGRLRWLFRLTAQPEDHPVMCREHEAMYAAIRAGDADRARRLAHDHVVANRRITMAALTDADRAP
ncbi:GntR family transcriptional regulator [Embleya sp. NBC_00888]|uniref:GntR family transcriptional regulator n=1 Tax=Embleya sp. NBC_00888 TaxID=2975960 RepID=UPI0038671EBE|nr:GntR family transcriptional regulator [Embleya sp. NBC_00888]